jgi:ubiquinone/menaquinone biosynthesis C-methylase UbiE
MVAYARSKAETRQVDVQITEGSADKLPYDAASFDVVFCTLVLHHLPETMQTSALKEMRRVLHPGGRIVMVDWQRPKSIAKALFSPTFLVYLLHTLGSVESAFDKLGIEARLAELCFDKIARVPFGAGAIAAVTGRLGPSI